MKTKTKAMHSKHDLLLPQDEHC